MSKKTNNDEFLLKLKSVNENIVPIDVYLNNHTKIKVKCIIDGCEWFSTPNNLLRGHGCPSCKKTHLSLLYKMTDADFKNKLSEVNENIVSLDKYSGYDQKIMLKCLICNNCWKSTPHHILNNHGCPKCSARTLGEKSRKTHAYFENQVLSLGGGEYSVVGEYTTNKTPVEMLHINCGNRWFVRPDSFLFSDSRCPRCKYSNGEMCIIKFLDKVGINYEFQYKIPNQKGKGRLSFDFYIYDYNLCIEYHGRQHYEPIEFFGGVNSFEKQKKNDNKKEKHCLDNNIRLLIIPYWDFNNIDEILEQTLS